MAKIRKIDDELKLASQGVKTATDNFNNMSYDNFKQGSMYQGLQKSYSQQGQQAMKDTLGQMAARTGGMASSYANTASQQAYNNYMQQLEDVARAMYNDEYSKARDKVSLAQNEYDRLYGEKRDAISDQRYDTEREEARVANDAYYGNALDYTTYQANGGTLSEQAYNSIVAAAKGKYADDHWEQNRIQDSENKAITDKKLMQMLAAEDFDWDNHDWDGDGDVDDDDKNKIDEFFSGSNYGSDYWYQYWNDAQAGHTQDRYDATSAEFEAMIANGMTLEKIAAKFGIDGTEGKTWKDVTGMSEAEWKNIAMQYMTPNTLWQQLHGLDSETIMKIANGTYTGTEIPAYFEKMYGAGSFEDFQKLCNNFMRVAGPAGYTYTVEFLKEHPEMAQEVLKFLEIKSPISFNGGTIGMKDGTQQNIAGFVGSEAYKKYMNPTTDTYSGITDPKEINAWRENIVGTSDNPVTEQQALTYILTLAEIDPVLASRLASEAGIDFE